MRRRVRTVGRWMLLALVATVGVRRLIFLRALDEAARHRPAIARRYGEGCVAVLRGEDYPEPISCRVEGVRADAVLRQPADGGEVLALYALCLDPRTAERARYVVDSFTPDGHFIASSVPVDLFHHLPHFGEPIRHGQHAPAGSSLPMIVALRAPRKGE